MKKFFYFLSVISVWLLLIGVSSLNSEPKKPPKAKTGAPGEGTCVDCHTGTPLNGGKGSVSVAFSGVNNTYKSNKNYTITVTVEDPDQTRFAFEIVSLDENGLMAGKPTITDTAFTTMQNDNSTGRKYVSNFLGSSLATWTYKWKAPSTATGDIVFYACGNAANWDHATTGDHGYSTTLAISPYSPMKTESDNALENTLSIYPNPAHDQLTADFSVTVSGEVTIDLYDLKGALVEELFRAEQEAGQHKQSLQLHSNPSPGIYLLTLKNGNETKVNKVVVQ